MYAFQNRSSSYKCKTQRYSNWLCLVCFKLTLERGKRSGRYILNWGGNVPTVAFDGQFHRVLAIIDKGKPLAYFQLKKKHCWESVRNMPLVRNYCV